MSGDADEPEPTAVTRVEFQHSDPDYPFMEVTAEESCRARLEEIIPRDDGYAEFFTFTGARPGEVFDAVNEMEMIEARLLMSNGRNGLFEFIVSRNGCPAVFLAEEGALPRTVRGSDGEARLVADIPTEECPSAVIQQFLERYEGADLATKQEQSEVTPMFGEWELRRLVNERFTERQREVLLAAHEHGYYQWPREIEAQALAAELDIASATLHKHLRAAERKLVTALFERPIDRD